jgi:uncharacterized protein (DUF1499 family)
MSHSEERALRAPPKPLSRIALAGLGLAVLAALAALLPGPAYRFGGWSLDTAFAALRWAVYTGMGAVVVAIIGAILARPGGPYRGFPYAVAGVLISLVVVGVPLAYLRTAQSVPPIHDVATDTENPPAFEAILPLRADAPNAAVYAGEETAAQQRGAYPEIKPQVLPVLPDEAFGRALAVARKMGWEIVAAEKGKGRIEATDTTFWFGFKDDVVIRIQPAEAGSRVDVRSTSRVGVGDLGVNAARIRRFLEGLREQG